ncbi:MAG TPA: formate dehydrogenase subunit gamma [Burkholderiaceae bacterium]|nr:formate dehydrogenase subunit gamma [Burkholderiaceae bacterium]
MTPEAAVAAAIELHAQQPGGLLPLLHEIQDRLGYVPPQSLGPIAKAMHLSVAEVHGVLGFYHHFRQKPPGRHILRLCLAEACQSMGSRQLLEHARKITGADLHATSPDGALTLEPVYCLGNCACSPAVLLDKQLFGRVDAQRLEDIVERCREAT